MKFTTDEDYEKRGKTTANMGIFQGQNRVFTLLLYRLLNFISNESRIWNYHFQ